MQAKASKTINLRETTAQRLDPHEPVPLTGLHWLILIVVFLAAFLIRLPDLTNPPLETNSAWVGLMADQLTKGGEFSAFLWGRPYAGSLNAFLASFFFSVFGTERLSLSLVALCLYLFFLLGVFTLTRELYGRKTGLWALFLASIGPHFMIKSSLSAQGGGLEILCLLVWMLWCTIKSVHKPVLSKGFMGYASLASLLAGLGFWAHPFFICFILAAFFIYLRQAPVFFTSPRLLVPLTGFLIGASPLIQYSLKNPIACLKKLYGLFSLDNFSANLEGNLFTNLSQALGFTQTGKLEFAWFGWGMAAFFGFFFGVVALSWGKDLATSPPKAGEPDRKSRGSGILLLSLSFMLAAYLVLDPELNDSPNFLLSLHLFGPVALAYVLGCIGQDKAWFRASMLILTALTILIWMGQSYELSFAKKPFTYPQNPILAQKAGKWFNSNQVKHVYTLVPEIAPMLSFDCGEKPLFTSPQNPTPLIYKEKTLKTQGGGFLARQKDASSLARTLAGLGLKFRQKHLGEYRAFYLTQKPVKNCTILSGHEIKASSESPGSPGLALDQNIATYFEISANSHNKKHLTLDLGQIREKVSLIWIFFQQKPNRLVLETSINGLDWRTLLITDSSPGLWVMDQGKPIILEGACLKELRFPPHKARYLRLKPEKSIGVREVMVGVNPIKNNANPVDAALWLAGQLKSKEKLCCPPVLWAQIPRHLRAPCSSLLTNPCPLFSPDSKLHLENQCQNLAVPQNLSRITRQVLLKSGWSFKETTSFGYTFFQAAPPVAAKDKTSMALKSCEQNPAGLYLDLGRMAKVKALDLNFTGPGGISSQDATLFHSADGRNWLKTKCQLRHSADLYWAGFLPLAADQSRVILEFDPLKCRFLRLLSEQSGKSKLPKQINVTVYGER